MDVRNEGRGVVAIDGRISGLAEATIPVLDRGFLYGDSVYEVVRVYSSNGGGYPFALAEHLERLARSAQLIEISLPLSLAALEVEVRAVIEAAGNGEWYIRVIVTRGAGPIGLDPALADAPRRVVIVAPLPDLPERLRREGVSVAMVPTGRNVAGPTPAGAKTGNYLTNVMALRAAKLRNAFEAIMLDGEGRVTEGTTSNVFICTGGALRTPPLATGILDGITRRKVIDLATRDGIRVLEEHVFPADVVAADEVFLTSTLKEVLPVTTVDGSIVGSGRPGPMATSLQARYMALVKG